MARFSLKSLSLTNSHLAILLLCQNSTAVLADGGAVFKKHTISAGTHYPSIDWPGIKPDREFIYRHRFHASYFYSFSGKGYVGVNTYYQSIPLSDRYPNGFSGSSSNVFRGIGIEAGQNYRLGDFFFLGWGVEAIYQKDKFHRPNATTWQDYENTKYGILPHIRVGFVYKKTVSLAIDNSIGIVHSANNYDKYTEDSKGLLIYPHKILGLSWALAFNILY